MPKTTQRPILRVAVAAPLRGLFDYLPPPDCDATALRRGIRLRVPFGRSTRIGVLLQTAEQSALAEDRLRAAIEVLDAEPVLPADILELMCWASEYYHHPLGEVLAATLPVALRRGGRGDRRMASCWQLTARARELDTAVLSRAPKQAALLERLARHPEGLPTAALRAAGLQGTLQRLEQKGWVERRLPAAAPAVPRGVSDIALNTAQQMAVDAVLAVEGYQAFLLDGVTGSGKTEVYLQLVAQCLAQGRQALVLLPEIGLTGQSVQRFARRLGVAIALIHSGLSEQERLSAWWEAAHGRAPVVIGTRSAALTPLARPGIFIVDEEHDLSFKQQDGFRYSARDLAVMRAHRAQVPVILGSATPSFESLHNVQQGRYTRLELPQRAGPARPPQIDILNMLGQPAAGGLSAPLLQAIGTQLGQGEQVLLFLNRRGYAPLVLCHDCGWMAHCRRCDATLTLHRQGQCLRCHHCGAQHPVERQCPSCGSLALYALGQGTERLEQVLKEHFPAAGIVRIDRDAVRRKGAFSVLMERIHAGQAQILIGTQMLAKGHHFPNVTLAAVVDADQGLFSVDFRAPERMAQLILQVAGRAGRAEKPGRVLIQTHYPHHPLLRLLITEGYRSFADAAMQERAQARLPPFVSLALLQGEAVQPALALEFLQDASMQAQALGHPRVQLLGPAPAPMERRAGRYRAQLLVQAERRLDLHPFLDAWLPRLEGLPSARKVRWSLDVDPMEMD